METFQKALARLLIDEGAAIHIDCGNMIGDLLKDRCWQTLMEIRAVLNDETLDDPMCFQRIERIVQIYENLGVGGGIRHDC